MRLRRSLPERANGHGDCRQGITRADVRHRGCQSHGWCSNAGGERGDRSGWFKSSTIPPQLLRLVRPAFRRWQS